MRDEILAAYYDSLEYGRIAAEMAAIIEASRQGLDEGQINRLIEELKRL